MSKSYTVVALPGDGIGPEVMKATQKVLEATGVSIFWETELLGMSALEKTGTPLPASTIRAISNHKVAIKGPTGTPVGEGHKSVNVELRKEFGLFTNVRPVRLFPGIISPLTSVNRDGLDIIVFRENVEDLYVGEERLLPNGEGAEAISRITLKGSERFARFVYAYARAHGRKKVTIGHKANILKLTHGVFFRDVAYRVAKEYPEIETNDLIADNLFQQLILAPSQFDCVLLPNFIGDLFSDAAAAVAGGLGNAPGANIGHKYAIFEAVHGTAPTIAGKGIANPSALILSGAMMLEYVGEIDAASRVRNAVEQVIHEGTHLTGDIATGTPVSTDAFALRVISKL